MKFQKILIVMLLALVFTLVSKNVVNAESSPSPVAHIAEIVKETVTVDGNPVEATGYIAYTDESGKTTILSIGTDETVTIDTDFYNNEKLKEVLNQVSSKSLSEINPNLDAVAQKINKNYNASVFQIKDLFDLVISDELRTLLDSNDSYYYTVTLKLETTSEKPIIMHLNEETNEWIIVDEKDITITQDGVKVNFYNLCPVMSLTVDETALDENAMLIPYPTIIFMGSIAGIAVIYVLLIMVRKKPRKK